MARVHLSKRTIIPQYKKEGEPKHPVNGEVRTYYLSEAELQRYREMPKPEIRKTIIPH